MRSASGQVLMLSIGAAVLLHLTALRLGSATLAGAREAKGAPSPRRVEPIELAPRPVGAVAVAPESPPTVPKPVDARPPRQKPPPPPPRPAPPPPAASTELAGREEGEVETRYYRSSEVERRAEPESDWNLDAAALDGLGIGRLVFDAYVDPDGRIVACRILEPEDLPDELRGRLEARLRETPMRPGTRLGAATATVQRIELSVVPPGP